MNLCTVHVIRRFLWIKNCCCCEQCVWIIFLVYSIRIRLVFLESYTFLSVHFVWSTPTCAAVLQPQPKINSVLWFQLEAVAIPCNFRLSCYSFSIHKHTEKEKQLSIWTETRTKTLKWVCGHCIPKWQIILEKKIRTTRENKHKKKNKKE